jgi:putative ABC transport system substrate-binding protein
MTPGNRPFDIARDRLPGKRRRAVFEFVLGVLLFALSTAAQAQPTKIYKVGWLAIRPDAKAVEVFRHELRDLGWAEGKNLAIEYRSADNSVDRADALAEELARLKVDVIVAPSAIEALAAKKAAGTIPIVCLSMGDPVALGLVDSLAKPGGNITGITNVSPLLAGKRLELLQEINPKLARIGIIWNPRDPTDLPQWKESQVSAKDRRLELRSLEVSSPEKFDDAFKDAVKARSGALAVIASPLTISSQNHIVGLAAKYQLPAIYSREDFVIAGGLMSYGRDQAERYKRGAVMVDKILKGAKAADLPIEQPTKFELLINLKTAKQLGLAIPPNMLARADKVIR